MSACLVGFVFSMPWFIDRAERKRAAKMTPDDIAAHELLHHRLWEWRLPYCPPWCTWPQFPRPKAKVPVQLVREPPPLERPRVIGRIGPAGRRS